MADILFKCPSCSQQVAAENGCEGQTFACPGCEQPVMVPMPGATFTCPSCLCELTASSDSIGEFFDCPDCEKPVQIPAMRKQKLQIKATVHQDVEAEEMSGAACPVCRRLNPGAVEFCVHCGNRLPEGERASLHCGISPVVWENRAQRQPIRLPARPPSQKDYSTLVGLVLAVVLLGVGFWAYTTNGISDSGSEASKGSSKQDAYGAAVNLLGTAVANPNRTVVDGWRIVENDGNHYLILLKFRSPNSFGAMAFGSALCCFTLSDDGETASYDSTYGIQCFQQSEPPAFALDMFRARYMWVSGRAKDTGEAHHRRVKAERQEAIARQRAETERVRAEQQRREELLQKQEEERLRQHQERLAYYKRSFASPVGKAVVLHMVNGGDLEGKVVSVGEDSIELGRGPATITVYRNQLTQESRIVCFATDYADYRMNPSAYRKPHVQEGARSQSRRAPVVNAQKKSTPGFRGTQRDITRIGETPRGVKRLGERD